MTYVDMHATIWVHVSFLLGILGVLCGMESVVLVAAMVFGRRHLKVMRRLSCSLKCPCTGNQSYN